MKHLMILLALAAAVLLSACGPLSPSNTQSLTPHQQIELTCNTIGAAYATASALNDQGKLTAAQQAQLRRAVAITDKTCLAIPYSWAEVAAGFVDQATIISALAKGAHP
jgi:hypothetical protein